MHFEVEEYENNVAENDVLVSVIIMAFNHEKYILKSLESVLNQKTNFTFEIILGEDESSDKTREICIGFAKKYPNKIRLILHSRENVIKINGHPTGRFNFMCCLKKANGKYIALCDGDDYWIDPLKLQKQVDFLENNEEYCGCFHKTLTINETDKKPKLFPFREYNKQIFTFKDTISKKALFHTSSFVFRAEKRVYSDDFMSIQSLDMVLFSTIAKSGNLFLIDDFMSVYRVNANGVTRSINHQRYHENRIILMDYLMTIAEEKYFDYITKVKNFHVENLDLGQKNLKYNLLDHNNLLMKVVHKIRKTFNNLWKFK